MRLLWNFPKRRESHFPIGLTAGGSISLAAVIQRATFRPYALDEHELGNIVSPTEPGQKLRYDVYNTEKGERRVRACNDHSIEGITPPETGVLPIASQFITHGATLDASHAIANDGFRLLGVEVNFNS